MLLLLLFPLMFLNRSFFYCASALNNVSAFLILILNLPLLLILLLNLLLLFILLLLVLLFLLLLFLMLSVSFFVFFLSRFLSSCFYERCS